MKKPLFSQQERIFVFDCLSGKLHFPNDYLLTLYYQAKAKQQFRKELEKIFNPIIKHLNKILTKCGY